MGRSNFLKLVAILMIAITVGILFGAINENRSLKKDLGYWQGLYEKQLQDARSGPFIDGKYDFLKDDKFI